MAQLLLGYAAFCVFTVALAAAANGATACYVLPEQPRTLGFYAWFYARWFSVYAVLEIIAIQVARSAGL